MYKKIYLFFAFALVSMLNVRGVLTTTEKYEKSKCVICLKNLPRKKFAVTLACNHVFHTNCIWRWGLESCSCPLCRQSSSIFISKKALYYMPAQEIKKFMLKHKENFVIKHESIRNMKAKDLKKKLIRLGGIKLSNKNCTSENRLIFGMNIQQASATLVFLVNGFIFCYTKNPSSFFQTSSIYDPLFVSIALGSLGAIIT